MGGAFMKGSLRSSTQKLYNDIDKLKTTLSGLCDHLEDDLCYSIDSIRDDQEEYADDLYIMNNREDEAIQAQDEYYALDSISDNLQDALSNLEDVVSTLENALDFFNELKRLNDRKENAEQEDYKTLDNISDKLRDALSYLEDTVNSLDSALNDFDDLELD